MSEFFEKLQIAQADLQRIDEETAAAAVREEEKHQEAPYRDAQALVLGREVVALLYQNNVKPADVMEKYQEGYTLVGKAWEVERINTAGGHRGTAINENGELLNNYFRPLRSGRGEGFKDTYSYSNKKLYLNRYGLDKPLFQGDRLSQFDDHWFIKGIAHQLHKGEPIKLSTDEGITTEECCRQA